MAAQDQKPIGSGYGAKTEAADIVDGVDLSGKTTPKKKAAAARKRALKKMRRMAR